MKKNSNYFLIILMSFGLLLLGYAFEWHQYHKQHQKLCYQQQHLTHTLKQIAQLSAKTLHYQNRIHIIKTKVIPYLQRMPLDPNTQLFTPLFQETANRYHLTIQQAHPSQITTRNVTINITTQGSFFHFIQFIGALYTQGIVSIIQQLQLQSIPQSALLRIHFVLLQPKICLPIMTSARKIDTMTKLS